MTLATAFTELMGCSVPIQLAPMGGVATPAMLAAVTEAGAMGGLGAGPMPPAALAGVLEQVAAATTGPVGVNVLIPSLDLDVVKVAAAHARLVDFYHGEPDGTLVELVHEHGALAGWQVGSLAAARHAVDAGCDVLIVRGVEGGGRMHGTESLWPLLVEVLDEVADTVPVLAAGGIGDGRGLAAALAAGAAGVRMGTRFLAAAEAAVHPAYRDAVIAASAADTVLTDEFRVGWPDPDAAWSRVLRASLDAARSFDDDVVGELHMGPMALSVPRLGVAPPLATSTGHVEAMPMYAGESVRFVRAVESAGDIVRSIAAHAENLLGASHD